MTIPWGNNLIRAAELSSDGDFLRLFFKSVSMATTSSVLAVLIAFPIAYYLAFGLRKSKYTWLIIVIAPFLTSYLLRIFAWKLILGDQGIINTALFESGLRSPDNPLSFLIYSQFTVILVLLYAWVPFIVLPIFIALENLDRRLLEASTDLGASRLTAIAQDHDPAGGAGHHRRLPVRVHPLDRRVHHALARRRQRRLHVRPGDRAAVRRRHAQLADGIGALRLPARRRPLPDARDVEVPPPGRRCNGMTDVFMSRTGRWLLITFFGFFLVFLYAPTIVLIVFSFNDSVIAALPFEGFTTRWYEAAWQEEGVRDALWASVKVAFGSAFIATGLGLLVSYAIARRRFGGKAAISAIVLVPLVVPTVVLGVSLLVLFRPNDPVIPVPLSLWAVLIGHIVIAIPFCVLILLPRLASIDRRLEEAAEDLGASWTTTFRRIILPLITPAVLSSIIVAFVVSFDEVVIASFVVGDQITLPVYLYSGLRFAERVMLLVPVATVMIAVSFVLVIAAEFIRRIGERRVGVR